MEEAQENQSLELNKMQKEEEKNQSLPENIILEILARLPAKSIIRFREESKLWRIRTLDPYFINMHLNRARPALILQDLSLAMINPMVIDKADESIKTLPLNSKYFTICGSCNGLLCLRDRNYSYQIWNPTTHQILNLPEPSLRFTDILSSLYFDPTAGEYKVVRITSGVHLAFHPMMGIYIHYPGIARTKCMCEILTLGTSSWRKLTTHVPNFHYSGFNHHVLANGVLHMIHKDRNLHAITEVLSLDLKTETFTTTLLPENLLGVRMENMVEWEGYFALAQTVGERLVIWVLEDHKRSIWRKKVDVCRKIVESHKSEKTIIRFVAIMEGELLFLDQSKSLNSYNLISGRLTEIYSGVVEKSVHAHRFVSSLVSLDGMQEQALEFNLVQ